MEMGRQREGEGGEEEKERKGMERDTEGKCFCGNGVCHLVAAAGCCRGGGRQMDHEYCLDTLQPDALHFLSPPLLLVGAVSTCVCGSHFDFSKCNKYN